MLNSKMFLKFLQKKVVLHRAYQFLRYTHDFLNHHQKHFCAISHILPKYFPPFHRNFLMKTMKFPETLCNISRSDSDISEKLRPPHGVSNVRIWILDLFVVFLPPPPSPYFGKTPKFSRFLIMMPPLIINRYWYN